MSRSGLTTRDRNRDRRLLRAEGRRAGASVTPLPNRRRQRRRAGGRRRAVQAGLAVLLVATAAWVLWASPFLAVQTVRVDGAGTLPPDQVRAAAGIDQGTPLLRVDVAAAADRVAELPQVASVEVTRGWPRTVVVTVVERVPVAVVGGPGRRALVDAEGVLFDSVSGAAPEGVVPLDVARPGPDDPTTRAALAALVELPADVRADVAGASATSPEDLVLTLTDATVVRWGSAEESEQKAAVLTALLEQIAAGALEPAARIDVSAPDAVVLR